MLDLSCGYSSLAGLPASCSAEIELVERAPATSKAMLCFCNELLAVFQTRLSALLPSLYTIIARIDTDPASILPSEL